MKFIACVNVWDCLPIKLQTRQGQSQPFLLPDLFMLGASGSLDKPLNTSSLQFPNLHTLLGSDPCTVYLMSLFEIKKEFVWTEAMYYGHTEKGILHQTVSVQRQWCSNPAGHRN
jgi:hypothetical protein